MIKKRFQPSLLYRHIRFSLLIMSFVNILQGQNISQNNFMQLESVVWVEASRKAENSESLLYHSGTGFFWMDDSHVITCLHLVAGSESIVVYSRSELLDQKANAIPIKVLIESDLVLLELDHPMKRKPINKIGSGMKKGQKLIVNGFPLEIERPGSNTVMLRDDETRKLREIVSSSEIVNLEKLNFPSLEAMVLDLEGALLPGHSGAPLQNSEGELLGICLGGLKSGTVNRAYAIPVSELKKLNKSKAKLPHEFDKWILSESLFSFSRQRHPTFVMDNQEPFRRITDGYNVLILPFKPLENCKVQDTEVEETLKRRLLEKSEKESLGLQIKRVQSTHCPSSHEEVREIGRAFGADLVLWGEIFEKCYSDSEACLKYTIINEASSDFKLQSMSDIERISMTQVMEGKLQNDIDNILRWTVGLRLFKEKKYKHALDYFVMTEKGANAYTTSFAYAGICNLNLKRYHEAQMCFENEVKIREETQGDDDPKFLVAMNNVAVCMQYQNNLTEAISLHKIVLFKRKKMFGELHPDTMRSLNNLANSYTTLGDLEGAKKLDEQASLLRISIMGEKYSNSLQKLNNLASYFISKGDLIGARNLQTDFVEFYASFLIPYPNKIPNISNKDLNSSYLYKQSDVMKKAVETFTENKPELNTEISQNISRLESLAADLFGKGDFINAQKIQEQILKQLIEELGPDNAVSIKNKKFLITILDSQDKYKESRLLKEQILNSYFKLYGEQNSLTVDSIISLLSVYLKSESVEEFHKLYKMLLWLKSAPDENLTNVQKGAKAILPRLEFWLSKHNVHL